MIVTYLARDIVAKLEDSRWEALAGVPFFVVVMGLTVVFFRPVQNFIYFQF